MKSRVFAIAPLIRPAPVRPAMRGRVLVFVVVLAVVLPTSPVAARRKYKPPLPPPSYGGYLTADSTCPVATHLLTQFCIERPLVYVAFHRMKGVKRFEGGLIQIHGPTIDTTSCSLPVVEPTDVEWRFPPPPPCG